MKKTLFSATALITLFAATSAFACDEHEAHASTEGKKAAHTLTVVKSGTTQSGEQSTVFSISKMVCSSCRNAIEASLKKVNGVKSVNFDMKKKTAEVIYLAGSATPVALMEAVKSAGFEALPAKAVQ